MSITPSMTPWDCPRGYRVHRLAKTPGAWTPYLIVLLIIIYLYSITSNGHFFNEDYAVYFQQAWNISHDVAMNKMGVIQYTDQNLPFLHTSPLMYPPLLPLIYAVPVKIFGFDLAFFKILQLAILACGLYLFCYAMKKWQFSAVEISTSVMIFGFSIEVRRSVNSIGADLPFIFFLILALLAIFDFVRVDHKRIWRAGILCGIAIFLAIDLRTVGVALLPTLLLSDLLVHRRGRFGALAIPVGTVAALALVQHFLGWESESYGFVLQQRFFTPGENLHQFYWALMAPLSRLVLGKFFMAILIILVVLAAVGLLWEASRGMAIAIFMLCYTVLLLVLPDFNAGARYLVPHLLVLGAFAVRGAALVGRLLNRKAFAPRACAWGTAGLAVMGSVFIPPPLPAGHWNFGVTSPAAREVFRFIRERVPANDLVAASPYRSFHLFTDRTTIRIPVVRRMNDLESWARSYHVHYIVLKYSVPRANGDLADCPGQPLCTAAIADYGIEEIFRNADFAIFQLDPEKG